MIHLRDNLMDLVLFHNSLSKWSLDGVNLNRWGFW